MDGLDFVLVFFDSIPSFDETFSRRRAVKRLYILRTEQDGRAEKILGKFLGGGGILDGTSIVVRIIIIRSIGSECLFHFVIQIISICDFHTRSLLSFLVLTYYTSNVYDTSLDN